MKKYIIIKKNGNEEPGNETNEFWKNKEYVEYKKKNGMNFTDKLADWAASHMVNADGKVHSWKVEDVKAAFPSLGFTLKNGYTWGDVAYMANMIYADYIQCLKSETDALKMANAIMNDPDGYDGMIFNRYTADIMSKNVQVPWGNLM